MFLDIPMAAAAQARVDEAIHQACENIPQVKIDENTPPSAVAEHGVNLIAGAPIVSDNGQTSAIPCKDTQTAASNKRRYIEAAVAAVKVILLAIIIYSATSYAENPNQLAIKIQRGVVDTKFLFWTHQSLLATVITVSLGFIRRLTRNRWVGKVYFTLLPIAFTMELVVVCMFWPLYFLKPELIISRQFLQPYYKTYLLTELGQHLFPFVLITLDQWGVIIRKHVLQTFLQIAHFSVWAAFVFASGSKRGRYIYPFLNKITSLGGIIFTFFLVCTLMCTVLRIYLKIKDKK